MKAQYRARITQHSLSQCYTHLPYGIRGIMKKLTIEECGQIGISTIVREQKKIMSKLRPRWDRKEFYSVLNDRLECMTLFSLRQHSPLELRFTSSSPHFGGQRYWLLCPRCGKRVGKLYRPKMADKFECRHCHRLTYTSSQKHNHRVYSLSKLLKRLQKAQDEDAFNQVANGLLRTKRSCKLLIKASGLEEAKRNARSLSHLWCREKEIYDKYVLPLLGS